MRCVRVRVTGTVQGVGYRAWTEAAALRLGLSGWVRNRRDGAVEALICGDPRAVDEMLSACRKGPHHSTVQTLDVIEDDVPAPTGFQIRPTL